MKLIINIIFILFGQILSAQTFEKYIINNRDEFPKSQAFQLSNDDFVINTLNPTVGNSFFYRIDKFGVLQDSLLIPLRIIRSEKVGNDIYFIGVNNLADSTFGGSIDIRSFVLNSIRFIPSPNNKIYSGPYANDLYYSTGNNSLIFSGYVVDTLLSNHYYIASFDLSWNINSTRIITPDSAAINVTGIAATIDNIDGDSLITLSGSFDTLLNSFLSPMVVTPMDYNLNYDSTRVFSLESPYKYPSPWTPQPISISYDESRGGFVQLSPTSYIATGSVLKDDPNNLFSVNSHLGYAIFDQSYQVTNYEYFGQAGDSIEYLGEKPVSVGPDAAFICAFHEFKASNLFSNYDNHVSITKVSKSGSLLWTKYYSNNNFFIGLGGILATSDGGAMLYTGSVDITKGLGLEHDVYLLKIDSSGNSSLSTNIVKTSEYPRENTLVYPNPVKDILTVIKANEFSAREFILFDQLGKEIIQRDWLNDELKIDVSPLSKGIYFYTVINFDGRLQTGKVVKH